MIVVMSRPQDKFSLFWKEEIWNRRSTKGRFRYLSCRSTRYGEPPIELVSSPRCGSAYHMVAMTPSGTVRSSVL